MMILIGIPLDRSSCWTGEQWPENFRQVTPDDIAARYSTVDKHPGRQATISDPTRKAGYGK